MRERQRRCQSPIRPGWPPSGHQRRSTHVYQRGRVMLAGDAVHVHSPAGGQGMNTGIMDAHNLAWKLALVASGHAPERLLDTCGQERGPVAAEVLALTHALVQLGTMTHPVPRAVRNIIVPVAGHLAPVQPRAVRRISHIHVAYPSSPLTHPDRIRAGIRPGQRAPDLEVTANGAIYPALPELAPGPARTPDAWPSSPAGTCRPGNAHLARPDRGSHGTGWLRPGGKQLSAAPGRLCRGAWIRGQSGQSGQLPAPAVQDRRARQGLAQAPGPPT